MAIVGTRKPTPYGKNITKELATDLAKAGVVVISGNAIGVDVVAQDSALTAGGKVITVLPSGLEKIYPAVNKQSAHTILENGGTIISEYPADHMPRKHDFLHRNRLIAALADAVIVTEATTRSGSLNTAKHASSIGVPVFAVPGNVTSPMSTGTNKLLAYDEALAITCADDLFRVLNLREKPSKKAVQVLPKLTEDEVAILTEITNTVTDIDTVALHTGLDIVSIQAALSSLEMQSLITQDSLGNWHIT